jgi:hypothetical protein
MPVILIFAQTMLQPSSNTSSEIAFAKAAVREGLFRPINGQNISVQV